MSKMSFTKFNNVRIYAISDDAVAICLNDSDLGRPNTWLPRSGLRSDDDRRMGEVRHQLQAHDYIKTHLHIADWLKNKNGWRPQ